jgi:hypothetical protein
VWLNFDSGQAGSIDPAFLYTGFCEDIESLGGCEVETTSDPATNLTFTRVPEPGTLALLLGALGGGWLARRRRKAA